MFKQGISGNPNGRPEGSKNRFTGELRQMINGLLCKTFDQITSDFEALEPRDRVAAWCKLAEYVLPKLQRSETVIDVSQLSDEEVDRLLKFVSKNQHE